MKIITYSQDTMVKIRNALDQIQISGIDQARLIVYIANMLESGELKNRHESGKEEPPNETD